MWTDSVTLFSWIINPAIQPTYFIRRKLDKLAGLEKKFTNVHHHYVPTKSNPADIASCGLNLLRDRENHINLWLNGPSFLRCTKQWPLIPKLENQTLEIMHVTCIPSTDTAELPSSAHIQTNVIHLSLRDTLS